MSETLTNGVIVPDKGSRDWYADLRSNWLKLDSLMAGGNITINPAQTKGILVATITVGGKEYKLYQQDGDVSVKIDPSTENAEYPLVASTSAETNTGSVVMAPAVTVNPSTGAVTATNFKGKLEGNASTATTATKAVQDGAGAVIADTYATKSELTTKANDANVVHKSGDETIAGTKTFSNIIPYLKFTDLESNTTKPTTDQYKHIKVIANDGSQVSGIQFAKRSDGSFDTTIYSHGGASGDSNNGTLRITSNNEVYPIRNNIAKLGTSANKWSEVWAKTFNGNLVAKQINTSDSSSLLRIFGGTAPSTGANLDLYGENESTSGGNFVLRARNSSGYKALIGKIDGTLTWMDNEILTRVNGVTLDTAQTITGEKTFRKTVHVKDITGNPGNNLWVYAGDLNASYGKVNIRFDGTITFDCVDATTKKSSQMNLKPDGTLTWCSNNVLTNANQIMLAKNLTGANITPGGVVDCRNGNGKLKLWYLGADGTFLLSNTLPTGIWKSTSFVTLSPNEGGIFIKLS